VVLLAAALPLLVAACKKPPVDRPPVTPPAPSGVTSGRTNTSYDFTATTTDPDGDSICFRFQWGDGTTSEWSNWVAIGDTITMSHLWADSGTFQLKTQAKDPQDSTSAWSATLTVGITPNHPPNAPAVPSGPSTARKDSACLFTASATDPEGDSVSYRFDWGNGDTSAWGGLRQSGHTHLAVYAYPRSGSFQVRAQARDTHGAHSAWSDPLSVSIRNPYPPTTPSTPSGPDQGRRGDTLGFSSTASDSGGDSVSIRFSWGDGDTSAWSTIVCSGGTVQMTHAWPDTGEFSVQAQARDEEGLTSKWSWSYVVTITLLKWRYYIGNIVNSSPAVAADGTVYVGSWDHYLYAINPDGSLKWRYLTGGNVWASPAVAADGTVYVGSEDSCLYAIYPDGSLKWRYQTGERIESSPAVAADGTVYVGSNDFYLYAINPNGTRKWRYETDCWVWPSPAIGADGTVYVGSDGNCLYAINPDGSLKWRYQAGRSTSPAVAADGTVYVGSDDHYLYAMNPDGSLKWRYQTGDWVESSPVVAADGTVYVGSWDHYLYAINPDGSCRWRYRTGYCVRSSPAVAADGTVYFGSYDCYLHALAGDSPLADSPWPKFHHDNKNTGRVGGGR